MFSKIKAFLESMDLVFWLKFVSLLLFTSIMINIATSNKISSLINEKYIYQESVLSNEEKLVRLEDGFVKYKKATSLSHIVNWNTWYQHIRYELNGNVTYNMLDCSGIVIDYMRHYNGNPDVENSHGIYLQMRKYCKRRKSPRDVKPGDVVFYFKDRRVHHMGLVVKRSGRRGYFVVYLDINAKSNKIAQRETSFWSRAIYSVEFEWFVGKKLRKHLKKYKRRNPNV